MGGNASYGAIIEVAVRGETGFPAAQKIDAA
jgi:hypothetical protein